MKIGGLASTALTGTPSLPVALLVQEITDFVAVACGLRLLRSK